MENAEVVKTVLLRMSKAKKEFHSPHAMMQWQWRSILEELNELQRHLSDPSCPCVLSDAGEYCAQKHSLGLHTLAKETLSMAGPEHTNMLEQLAEEALTQHEALNSRITCNVHDKREKDTVLWARQWRKKIEPIYYHAACKVPAAKLHQDVPAALFVTIGDRRYPVKSFAEASEKYRAVIDTLGVGVSKVPAKYMEPKITDAAGKVIGHIAYNGKVFPGRRWKSGDKPIYNPYDETSAQPSIPSNCKIIKTHDDGDRTIKCSGVNYVVTTDGKTFKETQARLMQSANLEKPVPKEQIGFDSDTSKVCILNQRKGIRKPIPELTKELLTEYYLNQGLTPKEIGEKYKVGSWIIEDMLKIFEIPKRTRAESVQIGWKTGKR
ncbi:MAG: hypothetical protein PHG61_08620, partial [Candidatus Marinimicrobia bacterium]|nr:hypothetical protein [Candidatus Neomarinimicrobiota bacterium]